MTVSPLDFCRDEAILAALERERQLARAYVLRNCALRASRAPGWPIDRRLGRYVRLVAALSRRRRVAGYLAAYCAEALRNERAHRRAVRA